MITVYSYCEKDIFIYFPTSRDEVLDSLVELEILSKLTLDGLKNSNKLPSVHSVAKEEPEKGQFYRRITRFRESRRTLQSVRHSFCGTVMRDPVIPDTVDREIPVPTSVYGFFSHQI